MADVKISELTPKGAKVAAGDQFEINDAGTSKSVTGKNITDGAMAAVTGETAAAPALGDELLIQDVSDTNLPKKATVQQLLDLTNLVHTRVAGNHTAVVADNAKLIEMDFATPVNFTLSPAATLGNGWFVHLKNTGVGKTNVIAAGAETIDDSTSNLEVLTDGGIIIMCDGVGFWTIGKAAGGGGLTLLASATAASSTSIDFVDEFIPDFEDYLVEFDGVKGVSDNVGLQMRVRQSGAFVSTGGAYFWMNSHTTAAGATAAHGSESSSVIKISGANDFGNLAEEYGSGAVRIMNPLGTAFNFYCFTEMVYRDNNAGLGYGGDGAGRFKLNDLALDGIQFLATSGLILQGEFKLYGRKKA